MNTVSEISAPAEIGSDTGLMANALFSYQVSLLWATLLLAAVVALVLLAVVGLLLIPLRRAVR